MHCLAISVWIRDSSDEVNQIRLAVSWGVVGMIKSINPVNAARMRSVAKASVDVMRITKWVCCIF